MKTINKIRVNNFEGMIEMTEKGETLIKKVQRILDENEPKVNVSEKTRLHDIYMDALARAEANGETININLLLEKPYDSLTENQRTAVYAWKEMEKRPELETAYDSQSAPPQFEQYSEPGYKPGSYREMFVTAPGSGIKKPIKFLDAEAAVIDFRKNTLLSDTLSVREWGRQEAELKRSTGLTIDEYNNYAYQTENWQDGHGAYSDIQNPIVRIRYNDSSGGIVTGKQIGRAHV